MKNYIVSIVSLMLLLSSVVYAKTEYSDGSITVGCQDGKIVVSGAFTAQNTDGESYTVMLVTYDTDGRVKKTEFSDKTLINEGKNTISASFEVSEKEQITKTFVLTDSLKPLCVPYSKTIKSFRLLSIGNSFSVDSQRWLSGIAKDGGYDNIILGNMVINGCSLETHWDKASNDSAAYAYYKNTTGTWTITNDQTLKTGITDENWDYITFQQQSALSSDPSSFEPYLTNLMEYVDLNKTNPDVIYAWQTSWAYPESNAKPSQIAQYESIIATVKECIVPKSEIDIIIPTGTAVQNGRTSYIGDNFNRDSVHLDNNYGRYLAGLMWYRAITGNSIDDITYIPNNSFSKEYLAIFKESVNNAYAKPYEVTNSVYTEAPEPSYNLDNYTQIDWEPVNLAFYMSTVSSNLITKESNSKYFMASKIFTKKELPVGTLIVVDEGYQYRPDGWISLDTKTTSRPENVSTNIVEITDEWWGDYNYRAFNISVKGASTDLTNIGDETASHFRIYIPKTADTVEWSLTANETFDDGTTTHQNWLTPSKTSYNSYFVINNMLNLGYNQNVLTTNISFEDVIMEFDYRPYFIRTSLNRMVFTICGTSFHMIGMEKAIQTAQGVTSGQSVKLENTYTFKHETWYTFRIERVGIDFKLYVKELEAENYTLIYKGTTPEGANPIKINVYDTSDWTGKKDNTAGGKNGYMDNLKIYQPKSVVIPNT